MTRAAILSRRRAQGRRTRPWPDRAVWEWRLGRSASADQAQVCRTEPNLVRRQRNGRTCDPMRALRSVAASLIRASPPDGARARCRLSFRSIRGEAARVSESKSDDRSGCRGRGGGRFDTRDGRAARGSGPGSVSVSRRDARHDVPCSPRGRVRREPRRPCHRLFPTEAACRAGRTHRRRRPSRAMSMRLGPSVMSIAPEGDARLGPAFADMSDQAAQMGAHFDAAGRACQVATRPRRGGFARCRRHAIGRKQRSS